MPNEREMNRIYGGTNSTSTHIQRFLKIAFAWLTSGAQHMMIFFYRFFFLFHFHWSILVDQWLCDAYKQINWKYIKP